MQKLRLLIPILFVLVLSCKSPVKQEAIVNRDFHMPILVQPKTDHVVKYFELDQVNMLYLHCRGKYTFTDTISWKEGHEWYGESPEDDYLEDYKLYINADSRTSDGFQIFPDYKTSVYMEEVSQGGFCWFFPVYIVNETSFTKLFYGQAVGAMALQEVIDPSDRDRWRPIEAKEYSFCGNGDYGIKVHPGEFVMLLAPKYKGEEEGLMRVRVCIGESLYISKSYTGTFSAKQLNIEKDSRLYRNLKEFKTGVPFHIFYGAIPKGYDRK